MNLLCYLPLLTLIISNHTIDQIFKTMPSELMPAVGEESRIMLLADSVPTSVPYIFGEIKKVKQSSDYLKFESSNIGTTQLKLLPLSLDSAIICVIKTVCSKACDSRILFYTTDWEKLDAKRYLPEIGAELFFDSSDSSDSSGIMSEKCNYALSLSGICPISAELEDRGCNLTLTFNYREYLSESHIEEVATCLSSDSLLLQWDNGSFR